MEYIVIFMFGWVLGIFYMEWLIRNKNIYIDGYDIEVKNRHKKEEKTGCE